MSGFRISGPGFYRTSDGKKVEITGISAEGYWLGISGFAVGAWLTDGLARSAAVCDIIAPWTEPKKGAVWVNVYGVRDGVEFLTHGSREAADKYAEPGRIACVSVNWTEGEGL